MSLWDHVGRVDMRLPQQSVELHFARMPVTPPTVYAKRFALPGRLVDADVCGFFLVRFKSFLIRKSELKEKLQNVMGSAVHGQLTLLIRNI